MPGVPRTLKAVTRTEDLTPEEAGGFGEKLSILPGVPWTLKAVICAIVYTITKVSPLAGALVKAVKVKSPLATREAVIFVA